MRFHGGAASHVGARWTHNDDAAFFGGDEGMALAVVADGLGGRGPARIGAELAIEVTQGAFARRFSVLGETWWRAEHGGSMPAGERPAIAEHVRHVLETQRAETPGDLAVLARGLGDLVCTALAAANEAIFRRATVPGSREQYGIASTVAAAIFAPPTIVIGHVGNVRVYRLRGGRLDQVTRDHSLVNDYALAMPDLTEEQIAELPANVVTRALGLAETVEVAVAQHRLQVGDTWLLVSNGLFDTLDEDAIAGIVAEHGAGAAPVLVEEGRGQAMDNLTAVVVTVSA